MAGKRGKQRSRRGGGGGEAPSLPRIYEGVDVLDRMLERAGAEVDGAGAISRLAAALAERKVASEVIPDLFPQEPRFGGPEEAMRLYGNLLGVWDLLGMGRDPKELAALRTPPPPAPEEDEEEEAASAGPSVELPPRGTVAGDVLPFEVVEGTWQKIADLPARERTRRQDRYMNLQPELAEWARTLDGLSGVGQETLEYLCFEIAEMFDQAFAERFGAVSFQDLFQCVPEEADQLQPYAVDYLLETLDEAEDEEEPITAEDREAIEAAARRAIVAMTRAVRS